MSLKTDLAATVTARRRLMVLQMLAGLPQYVADEVVLQNHLAVNGHPVAVADLREDLRHLRERDCLHLDTGAGVWIVTLTREGSETAQGLRPVEGVARPGPA